MSYFQASPKLTFLKTTIPLIIYGVISLCSDPSQSSPSHLESSTGSKIKQPNSSFSPLDRVQNLLLDAYNDYFLFLFMMLVINLSIMTISFAMKFIQRRIINSSKSQNQKGALLESRDDLLLSLNFGANAFSKHTSKEKLKGFTKSIILYSICYLFYQIIGFSFSHLYPGTFLEKNHSPILQFSLDQPDDSLVNPALKEEDIRMRILEEEEQKEEERLSLLSHQNEYSERGISLAIGKILASLNTGADSIVLSKDSKTAYVIVSPAKGLKVLDLTNLQSPSVISSPSLGSREQVFSHKLILSHDENTLFICNQRTLEIVNVSNPKLPKLIHKSNHKLDQTRLGSFYTMSLAITKDDKTLFIGGSGLVILNVTRLEAPIEILSMNSEAHDENESSISSLALTSDGETLYTINSSLCAYDVTDLKEMRMIYEYKTRGEANSIFLSSDERTAYIAGTTEDDRTIIEKVDISNRKSASGISIYEHNHIAVDIEEMNPIILALSPDETNLYIYFDIKQDFKYSTGLLDLNLMTGKFQDEGLVAQTSSIVFLPDKKHLLVGSESQLTVLELFLDYPNTEVFSLSNHSMSSFEIETPSETMVLSSDKKIMVFASGRNSFALEGWMEIWNIPSGNSISSTRFDDPIISIKLSQDNKKAYLMGNMKFHIYDISDLSSPKEIGTIPNLENRYRGLIDFAVAGDDSTAYILLKRSESEEPIMKIVNLIGNEIIGSLTFPETAYHHQLVLSHDNKRLFVIQENVQVFDVSNPSLLKEIISFPLVMDEAEKFIVYSTLSVDEKLLFVKTRQQNGVYRLKICNISLMTEANVLNEIYLPRYQSVGLPSVFSQKFDRVYSIQQGSILVIDILDLKHPKILGLIPLPNWKEGGNLNSVAISPEDKKIYILNGTEVQVIDLQIPYTLYINQEKFFLGRRYSDNVMLLKFDQEDKRYDLVDVGNYKFIKASLMEILYVPNSDSTKSKFLPLLYWMNFDKENGIFSVEPKYQNDINSYTLCVTFGTKIPINAFEKLTNNSEKLLVSLITLGYVDNQRFLSASFDEVSDDGNFLMTLDYSEIKSEVYEVLKGYLYKTCTQFEVIPSLELLTNSDKFRIGHLIGDNPRVDIKLDAPCKFLSNTYGNLQPLIPAEKDRITIEGSLKEVNAALKEIVVDLGQKNKTCGGELTLNDFSNPQVIATLRNISEYFIKNEYPVMASKESNLTIQDQFDATPISTGQFFALTLHEKTFTDKSSEKLTYEVFMNDTKKSPIPTWLTVRGLTFQGTPPEEIFGREVAMMMIVKNEFKETKVAFTMRIKMSSMFILKLVMRFAPYILTVIGFYISANRIYNIVLKKSYRNPKNFYAEVGKEITDKEIFPVSFIKEEKRESKLIMKYLARSVVKELDLIDTHKYQVPFYFADPISHHLNKARIVQVIEDVVVNDVKFEDKKKLRLYLSGDQACKGLIVQLVVNEIVMLQLNLHQEETTKSVFNKIKRNWTEIIERDESKYVVDKSKLNQVLIQKLGNSEFLTAALNQENYENLFENNESPILYEENYSEGSSASSGKVRRALDKGFLEYENKDSLLNMGLLEDALIAFAFECQSLDVSAIDTVVFVGQKVERNILYNFMKRDIKEIRFGEKYGIHHRVQNETLHFYGCPEERFNGKIMVVQIKTRKERILREIWIYGVGKENDEQQLMRESHLKGRRYEVL